MTESPPPREASGDYHGDRHPPARMAASHLDPPPERSPPPCRHQIRKQLRKIFRPTVLSSPAVQGQRRSSRRPRPRRSHRQKCGGMQPSIIRRMQLVTNRLRRWRPSSSRISTGICSYWRSFRKGSGALSWRRRPEARRNRGTMERRGARHY